MAVAIFNGFNHKENCIHFVKSQVEIEKETASGLAMQVEQEKNLASVAESIAESAEMIRTSTDEVKHNLEKLAEN